MTAAAKRKSSTTKQKIGVASAQRHASRQAQTEAEAIAAARAVGYEPSGDTEWVPVAKMFVDLTTPTKNGEPYGREPDRKYVMQMARDFDPDALGVVYLSYRESGPHAGKYAIIDGGHRVELMRAVGWGDQTLPAFVYRGLTIEAEAALFVRMNRDRRLPRPAVLFRSQVAAGDPEAVQIHRILTALDVVVRDGLGPNIIQAITTVQVINHYAGPLVLRKAVKALRDAWPTHKSALAGPLVEGAAFAFWATSGLDAAEFSEKLRATDPMTLMSRARLLREVDSTFTSYSATARVLLDAYNARRRTNKVTLFTARTWPKRDPYEAPGRREHSRYR